MGFMLSSSSLYRLRQNLYRAYAQMNNVDWDNIRYFLAAARTRSLSAASRALDSNQPTVGRRIDALEAQLGLRLFQRHSTGLTLTEDGQRLIAAAELMEAGAADVVRASQRDTNSIAGTVRIAAPEGLGVSVLTPSLPELCKRYPLLDVVLEPAVTSSDLKRGQADIALRLFKPADADLISRRLCEMGFGLYASADYLAQQGAPESVDALQQHAFIAYGDELKEQEENAWLEAIMGRGRCLFRSNNTLARLSAVTAGMGIAVMPHLLMAAQSGCVRILPQIEGPSRTIWLVVHGDLRHVARIRVVMGFVSELFQERV
jgi:DNA-binding transcriptional LysR family regulator